MDEIQVAGVEGARGEEAAPSGEGFRRFARHYVPQWMVDAPRVGSACTFDKLLELLAMPTSVARVAFDLGRRWEQRVTVARLSSVVRQVRAS